MAETRGVKHLVVDSGAFIRNAPLREIGESIYTLQEVVAEIRDKATRQRLQVLPYQLQYRQPPAEAIKKVTDFSKKTGDYPSLSAVDIRVMALAYQLEKEHAGEDHIKVNPEKKATWTSTKHHLEKPTEIAGFYLSKKKSDGSSRTTSVSQASDNCSEEVTEQLQDISLEKFNLELEQKNLDSSDPQSLEEESDACIQSVEQTSSNPDSQFVQVNVVDRDAGGQLLGDDNTTQSESKAVKEGDSIPVENIGEEESEEESNEDEDDDDEGWITPSNIAEVKQSMGDVNIDKAVVDVGCVTTDFAMQNVLIQMGLNVVSVDGMLIHRAKSYVLRCSACIKVTTKMTSEFCPHCGNKTLQKISMTVDDDGNVKYFLSRRKPPSTRGLKYSLPAPCGGKHAINPILCADQREAQQRAAKASKGKYDVFDPDYVANASPFAPVDIHSRAGQLGIRDQTRGFQKRNPNTGRKKGGRRK